MNPESIKPLATELAKKVNEMVNIPFVIEDNEEKFFEMLILLVLDTLLSVLGKNHLESMDSPKNK